jgi:16S rRNA processing protein RimM
MPRRKSFATRVKAAARKREEAGGSSSTASHAPAPATQALRRRQEASGAIPAGDASGTPTGIRRKRSKTGGEEDGTKAKPARRAGVQTEPDEGYVAVGRVLSAFGLKGELKVQALTDNPDRFKPKSKLWAGDQPVTVLRSREAQGHVYLTLKGFPDRTSVERLRHRILQVPESELPALAEGEYYRFQLIGLEVVDRGGNAIGRLEEVIETGANDVYRVRTPEGADVLLAATADVVVRVEVGAGRMVVDPPEWR